MIDPTDTQVATYADNYFEYGATGKVSKEIAQGAGCSSCTGGYGTFAFEYADNPPPPAGWAFRGKCVRRFRPKPVA